MTRFSFNIISGLTLFLGAAVACSAGPGGGADGSDSDKNGDGDGDLKVGDGDSDGGDGDLVIPDGTGGKGDDMEPQEDCDATIELTVRDLKAEHPDMEAWQGQNEMACGLVKPDLFIGADGTRTPEFQASIGTGKRDIQNNIIICQDWIYENNMNVPPNEISIQNAESFASWFSSDDSVNSTFTHTLTLTEDVANGTFYFDSDEIGGFWPADGKGFNEVTQGHNFHFTTEAHVRFGYHGGERFTFSGDDDMWIFVNGKLALDLGGTHGKLTATIDFDAQAAALGIEKGRVYNMDIFHSERHTDASNYRVETNISCFETVEVPVVVVR